MRSCQKAMQLARSLYANYGRPYVVVQRGKKQFEAVGIGKLKVGDVPMDTYGTTMHEVTGMLIKLSGKSPDIEPIPDPHPDSLGSPELDEQARRRNVEESLQWLDGIVGTAIRNRALLTKAMLGLDLEEKGK